MQTEPVFDWTNHKRLWNRLAETGGTSKNHVFKELQLPWSGYDCFACDYDNELKFSADGVCENCPFGDFSKKPGCLFRLYDKWQNSNCIKERKSIALNIARLPLRTDMEVLTK